MCVETGNQSKPLLLSAAFVRNFIRSMRKAVIMRRFGGEKETERDRCTYREIETERDRHTDSQEEVAMNDY